MGARLKANVQSSLKPPEGTVERRVALLVGNNNECNCSQLVFTRTVFKDGRGRFKQETFKAERRRRDSTENWT